MFIGLLLTIITGLFFLIGIYSLQKVKNKEKVSLFTISLAFVVLFGLLFFHLMPELVFGEYVWVVIGIILIIFLDKMIPHHHHKHTEKKCDKKDHHKHLNHIGIVTIIALAIHNLIEGIALYNVCLTSVKSGILMMISIALHNIPLGFQIGNSIKLDKKSKPLIFLLCISSFIGSLVYAMFGAVNERAINILTSITFGMLLYILIFEFLREIKNNFKKQEVLFGLFLGLIILIVTFLI